MLSGTWFVVMSNDNNMLGLNVNIKICTIVETKYFENKNFTEQKVSARYEKKIFKDPVIKTERIPVIVN